MYDIWHDQRPLTLLLTLSSPSIPAQSTPDSHLSNSAVLHKTSCVAVQQSYHNLSFCHGYDFSTTLPIWFILCHFNPFTAQASKFSELKSPHTSLQTYIFQDLQQTCFQYCAFWCKSVSMLVRKLGSYRISIFAFYSLAYSVHACVVVKGLNLLQPLPFSSPSLRKFDLLLFLLRLLAGLAKQPNLLTRKSFKSSSGVFLQLFCNGGLLKNYRLF